MLETRIQKKTTKIKTKQKNVEATVQVRNSIQMKEIKIKMLKRTKR